MSTLPRYPIYVPSKGRFDACWTAKFLQRDGVPFKLVVEEQEQFHYRANFPEAEILVLPFKNRGSVIPTRNWIKEHSRESGHERHWQLDDNIRGTWRMYKGTRIRCRSGIALRAVEDFTDRYENVAISGMEYYFFGTGKKPPFYLNCRVYSCSLILNSLPHVWRGRYNEDTDMCLQVLADGWCTVLINAFLVEKIWTMTVKGGNTKELYGGDGRLRMARSLERMWPGVVTTDRRFQRPQHVVRDSWRKFDTPLKLREGLRLQDFGEPNEYGMKLKAVKEVKSKKLRKMAEEHNAR
jgi:hypothetical protein